MNDIIYVINCIWFQVGGQELVTFAHGYLEWLFMTFNGIFQDARQRPDAKTLLSHPWIRNCRRALQSSLRHSGTLR